MERKVENSAESLARSHSKSSNAILTLLCIVTVIVFSTLWIFLSLYDTSGLSKGIVIGGASICGVLTILCLFGFAKFTR